MVELKISELKQDMVCLKYELELKQKKLDNLNKTIKIINLLNNIGDMNEFSKV